MFMGEYNHTIDAKGRLIIPSKFRESLGEEFVITKGLDGCLFVYDNQEWNAFEEKLKALPLNKKDNRQFVRFFLAALPRWKWTSRGGYWFPGICAILRSWKRMWYWSAWPAALRSGAKQDGKVSQRMRTRQWKTLRNVWQIWGLAYNGKVTAEWSLHTSLYFWTRQ